MSVPVSNYTVVSEVRARRAAEAYRVAERLGRSQRKSSEWRRLCQADRDRRDFYAFAELLDRRDNVEDATFEEIRPERERDHRVRAAYLMGAITAGSLCLLIGGLLF